MALNFGGAGLFPNERLDFDDGGNALMSNVVETAGRGKLQIRTWGNAIGAQTVTIYTVPADKVFQWTHYNIYIHANVAGSVAFYVRIDGVSMFKFTKATVPEAHQSQFTAPFTMPIRLTAGQTLAIQSDHANGIMIANFNGWLEDA